jgi:hypothetical protein
LDDVAKLAHVAWPAVRPDDVERFWQNLGQTFEREVARRLADQHGDERFDLGRAITERWNGHRNAVETEVQVFAEETVLDLLLEISVRRGNEADIERPNLETADARDLARFEDPQELRLNGERKLSHLVEENRAAVGRFEESRFGVRRARERALFVTEELAFEQVLGKGGAVESKKRHLLARRRPMEHLGDDVLAHARFSENEHVDGPGGYAGQHPVELAHHGVLHHDGPARQPHDRFVARRSGGLGSRARRRGAPHDENRGAHVHRFSDLDRYGHARLDPGAANGGSVSAVRVLDGELAARVQHEVRSRRERIRQSHVVCVGPPDPDGSGRGKTIATEPRLLHHEKAEVSGRRVQTDVRDLGAVRRFRDAPLRERPLGSHFGRLDPLTTSVAICREKNDIPRKACRIAQFRDRSPGHWGSARRPNPTQL